MIRHAERLCKVGKVRRRRADRRTEVPAQPRQHQRGRDDGHLYPFLEHLREGGRRESQLEFLRELSLIPCIEVGFFAPLSVSDRPRYFREKSNPMPLPTKIQDLVTRFEDHMEVYKSPSYNEAQLRDDFLNPFFECLGWDVDNSAGYAQAYRDVIKEDSLRIADELKAPDFSFRIGGLRKFFVEAKRPIVAIKDAVQPAYQLRRYAWSAKLPLSILTDFEEFAVYDCRVKPDKNDSATVTRVFYCTFKEYIEKWDWITSIFSREAILKGSFDKYAESNKTKRGTTEVDTDFLRTLEGWRKDLARHLALRNPRLNQRDLNFAVQRTIDRIIFLRICEDRGIEDYGRLFALAGRKDVYQNLCDRFREADARYNSGLFHYQDDKGRSEPPDELTLTLSADDRLFKRFITNLYYPESPYEFSMISADILGQVYEQFLGKVIRLSGGHRATVEDKPEVKKAGGVYYTSSYIVEYIVQQTLAKLLDGKTPTQITKLRLVDPACGSGSFLIAAYQFLLEWHLAFYIENEPKRRARGRRPVLVETSRSGWKLALDERKRILLDHIFGVDIDPQAVEVTKLSLLLKILEGETERTIEPYLAIFHERALPDLGNNIKCGNSLISTDFYEEDEFQFLSEEQQRRINVFDWKSRDGFKSIMEAGRFDVVIGNPPYIFTRELLSKPERTYFAERYVLSWEKHNTFMLFMEAMLRLLKTGGRGAFIVPNSWLTIESGKRLREVFIDRLVLVADLNYAAFPAVSMEPCIFVASGGKETGPVEVIRAKSKLGFLSSIPSPMDRKVWTGSGNRISISGSAQLTELLEYIRDSSQLLEKSIRLGQACKLMKKEREIRHKPLTLFEITFLIFQRRWIRLQFRILRAEILLDTF